MNYIDELKNLGYSEEQSIGIYEFCCCWPDILKGLITIKKNNIEAIKREV